MAEEPVRVYLRGRIPPEQWNKLGTRLIPKLRSFAQDLSLDLGASFTIRSADLRNVEADLRQALRDLGMEGSVKVETNRN